MKTSDLAFAFATIAADACRSAGCGNTYAARHIYFEQLTGARRVMTFCGASEALTTRADVLWSALNEVL